MFEDSFIGLLRQYPEAISDRKRFIALMKDFFPEQYSLRSGNCRGTE